MQQIQLFKARVMLSVLDDMGREVADEQANAKERVHPFGVAWWHRAATPPERAEDSSRVHTTPHTIQTLQITLTL
jgi:hypothetical protein